MLGRRKLGPVLAFLPFLLLTAACDGGPDWSSLRACPEGDGPWEAARDEARAGDRLGELAALADEAAAACPERWEPRWALAETGFLSRSGDPEADYREALRLAREVGDDVGISRSVNRLGWLAFARGDLATAERLYREALDASRRAEREDLAAFALGNLAGALVVAGDFASGQRILAEASRTLEALGREQPSAVTQMNRGIVQLELGDVNGARENLERAHGRLENVGDRAMAALAACQLGKLHVLTGDFDTAGGWLDRVSVDLSDQWAVAEVHRARGLLAQGRLDEAAERLDAALAATPGEVTRLFAGLDRAEVDLRRGAHDDARARLGEILADAAEAAEIEWWAQWLLARVALAEGDVGEARELLRLAVATIDGLGSGLEPRDQGLRWLRGRAEPVADLAAVLAASGGSHEELFAVMETAHARSLRRLLSGSSTAAPPPDLATLRERLGRDEVILSFLIGDERGAALVISREGVAAYTTPGWVTLREPFRRYREALARPGTAADAAGALETGRGVAEGLMARLAPHVEGARRVYVIPDRDLALIPPAALPLPANGGKELRFLGAVSETAVLPLAGTPPVWPDRPGPLLLAGDPLPDHAGEFPQLTFAARELARIGDLWDAESTHRLEGEQFTRRAVVEADLGRYGTLHLATHALASSLDPRRCAVVFSRGERLAFDEIAALPLGPSLVVLSACRTGEGELVPGEGVLGLGWAFLQAGARGVAASLWSVEDSSTAAMMVAFHRHMRGGDDPVRALARARREIRAEHPHPAFWAPFVLLLGPGR